MESLKRRTLLGLLSAGAAGLAVYGGRARGQGASVARGKSLIVLWLDGGPSQIETFDPKPGTAIGGPTRAIDTSAPGIQLAAGMPRLAERMDRVALVRSLASKEGDHERATQLMKTGYRPEPTVIHPSLGAICASQLPEDGTEIPRYVSVLGTGRASLGGVLGPSYDAFRIGDPQHPIMDVSAPVDEDRQKRRLENLATLERDFRARHPDTAKVARHDERTAGALRTMRSSQLSAFDLSAETSATQSAYGDTAFGRGCLVARRLVEVGVRCIEVTLGGWDTHAANFDLTPPIVDTLDQGMSALIDDLVERDLAGDTVVLCGGEFGRTPHINAADGRDHFPGGFSLALSGGGIRGGVVIGETSPDDGLPRKPMDVSNVYATVLQALTIEPSKEVETSLGRPIKLSEGTPLKELLI